MKKTTVGRPIQVGLIYTDAFTKLSFKITKIERSKFKVQFLDRYSGHTGAINKKEWKDSSQPFNDFKLQASSKVKADFTKDLEEIINDD